MTTRNIAKKLLPILLTTLILTYSAVYGQLPNKTVAGQTLLPNGWSLSPVGTYIRLGDLPLNIAVSPSKKLLAVSNSGQSDQTIELIDAVKHVMLDTILINKSWMGVTFSPDEKSLYASGGNDNIIIRYDISNLKLVPKDTIVLAKNKDEDVSPTGMVIDKDSKYLYVTTKENASMYVVDVARKRVAHTYDLGGEGYTCMLSPDQKLLYISCWGCHKIEIFNTEKQQFEGAISVGENPNDMCMSKDGAYLYVANANDNSVSIIDLKQRRVIEILDAALYPHSAIGSTTNSVALSEDNKTLYIANADNNCLAVYDVSHPGTSKSLGFIPTGWYPTCVRLINHTLFVANGRGFASAANPLGPNPAKKRSSKVLYQQGDTKKPAKEQYIGGLFRGTLSFIQEPDAKQLSIYSPMVYHNCPYSKQIELSTSGAAGNPIPHNVGDSSPIKYVFYILKENRTFDQVLSDVPGANGDTSLLLFGKKYTPNEHAITQQFVLLDNFYCDGEVSVDGHVWSTAAYVDDYVNKTWPTQYGGRGGGNASGTRPTGNTSAGYIWDMCKKYGVTYRTYGEFIDDNKPDIPALENHYCKNYMSWDQSKYDTTRYNRWRIDFDSLSAINQVPQLSTLWMPSDHTVGLAYNQSTPFAKVADNDLAVGLFIEHLSHTKIWKQCAVFIVEDDAQNGPDHVDAHRTTAYVAGGLVKQGYIDHTMYSTSSMLRTMELILGLPPMSQYDAAAKPMWRCFTDSTVHPSYTSLPEEVDLREKNLAINKWSRESDGFDFAHADRAPDLELNQVIWVAVKGEESTCPAPKHAAFIHLHKDGDDDDDK